MERELICMRINDSDEKGLFCSIPTGELYSFLDENGQLEMIFEGRNSKFSTSPILFYSQYDGHLMSFIKNSSYNDVLSLYSCVYSNDRKNKYYFILNIKKNYFNSSFEFYDGFYDLEFSLSDYDIPDDANILPFRLTNILGNYNQNYYNNNNIIDNVQIIVDSFSKKIIGTLTEYDMDYNELGTIIHYNDIRLKDYNIVSFEDLISDYYFYDNDNDLILYQKDNEKYLSINFIKNSISVVRNLEKKVLSKYINYQLYEKKESFEVIQKEVVEINKIINETKQDIFNFQRDIDTERNNEYNTYIQQNKYSKEKYKYYVSVCLLIKDENEYLEEWLDNYYNIGVEHFYIYDNGSSIKIEDTVKNIKNGFYLDKCTIVDYSKKQKHMQYNCYNNCLKQFGKETFWIGFVDTDELLEFQNKNMTIKKYLQEYEDNAILWIPWKVYNADGAVKKVSGSMKERFNKVTCDPKGFFGKVFLQPHRTKRMYVHLAIGKNNEFDYVVNQQHKKHYTNFGRNLYNYMHHECQNLYPEVWINHYVTRSYEEWCKKMSRGSCDPNFRKKFNEFFAYNPEMSYLKDRPEVQELLGTEQPYENNNS